MTLLELIRKDQLNYEDIKIAICLIKEDMLHVGDIKYILLPILAEYVTLKNYYNVSTFTLGEGHTSDKALRSIDCNKDNCLTCEALQLAEQFKCMTKNKYIGEGVE